jgi:very-short-patch-repair endonuclease
MPAGRKIVERARKLRRVMTAPEVRLWAWLRGRPGEFKFRRQHPVGQYVLDFYCPAARLVIEVDGEAHNRGDQPERDIARDAWCAEQGLRVLRIPAALVMNDMDSVSRGILAACHEEASDFPSTTLRAVPLPICDGEEKEG